MNVKTIALAAAVSVSALFALVLTVACTAHDAPDAPDAPATQAQGPRPTVEYAGPDTVRPEPRRWKTSLHPKPRPLVGANCKGGQL